MPLRTDTFDLGGLHLSAGEGRSIELAVSIDPLTLGAERYTVEPELVPVRLDISKTTGGGFALRLRFEARIEGPCMRCLQPAAPTFAIDAREVSQPGDEGEEHPPHQREPLVVAAPHRGRERLLRDAFREDEKSRPGRRAQTRRGELEGVRGIGAAAPREEGVGDGGTAVGRLRH